MKPFLLSIFLLISLHSISQPNLLYEINDFVPTRFIDPKYIFDDSVSKDKKIFLFVSNLGYSYDYYDDLKENANNANLSFWSYNSLYYKKFQFNLKATYYPFDGSYGFNTNKGIYIDNNYDRLKAGLIPLSEFRPKIQIGYYPAMYSNNSGNYDYRFQASWTPIITSGKTTSEYEISWGVKGLGNRKELRKNTFGQYYVTINPYYNIFSYGLFYTGTFQYFDDLKLSLNYVVNYNRYNHNGVDKDGFIYSGLSTQVSFIGSSKLYLLTAYSYNFHYNYQLFHLGAYFQLPLYKHLFVQ